MQQIRKGAVTALLVLVVAMMFALQSQARGMIHDISFNPQQYNAGDIVQVTLHGRPGGTATFNIGTLAMNIPMSETSPGTYVGTYQIPQTVVFTGAPIIGKLQKGNQVALMTAPNLLLSNPVAVGPNQILIQPIPSSLLTDIKIFDNVTTQLNPGDKVMLTLLGRPGGVATFDISSTPVQPLTVGVNGNSTLNVNSAPLQLQGMTMTEISPGTYTGQYVVKDGDSFNNSYIVGHLDIPTGERYIASTPTINDPAFYQAYISGPEYYQVAVMDLFPNYTAVQSTITTVRMVPNTMTQTRTITTVRPSYRANIKPKHPLVAHKHIKKHKHHRHTGSAY